MNTVDPEKIRAGIFHGARDQELALPAADLHFDGIRISEKFAENDRGVFFFYKI
jgi:hypothetical protein